MIRFERWMADSRLSFSNQDELFELKDRFDQMDTKIYMPFTKWLHASGYNQQEVGRMRHLNCSREVELKIHLG